jgi:hypothetical protein
MAIRLQQLRISLIWLEHFEALLAANPPARAPLAALGRRPSYEAEFNRARTRAAGLTLPWKQGTDLPVHYFWHYYFTTAPVSQVSSTEGWKRAVPLRATQVPKAADWTSGRLHVEGFHYPHAVAAVITLVLQEDLTLKQMIDKAVAARQQRKFDLKWPDGSQSQLRLDVLAGRTLDLLRAAQLGPAGPAGQRSAMPFSVATIIQGKQVNVATPVLQGGDIHRALEGLCSWHATWANDQLHDLVKRQLQIRHAPPGHLLYSLAKSRAVWFPDSFRPNPATGSMGCYHRNLSLLSLQMEALLALMELTANSLTRQPLLPNALEDFARGPAGLLGRLHGAHMETYRSSSPQAQILDNHLDGVVNQVRNYYHMPPLK